MDGALVNASVLVLNQNYEPMHVCDVRRAVVLMWKGKAELLENGQGFLRTPSSSVPVPSVIRLAYLVRRPFQRLRLSRRDVLRRDGYACQYCGRSSHELTLDHVVPRHRGGTYDWENVVSACIPCNHRKASRTPEEAGMALLRNPRAPRANPYHVFRRRNLREEWLKFIPWAG